MFILCTKKEKIRLKPDSLGNEYKKNIKKALYETYLFKAISENEVVVAIKEVILYDGFVEQVTGEVLFEIQITYLVQQITLNEVYNGTIISQNAKGINDKGEWIWQNDEEDESSVFFYETNSEIKFKICAINFCNRYFLNLFNIHFQLYKIAKLDYIFQNKVAKIDEVNPEGQKQIIGSMNEDGLGLIQWWESS